MVVPLKLNQFYGNKLPRPRIYGEVKFSQERVDPPVSVNEALLNWAKGAQWSMGGLAINRTRKQGSIEGDIRRLRAMNEKEELERDSVETGKMNLGGGSIEVVKVKKKKTQEYSESILRRREEVPTTAPERRGEKTTDITTGHIRPRAKAAAAVVTPVLQQPYGMLLGGRDEKVTGKDRRGQKCGSRKRSVREECSDSDDGVEEFVKEKHRPLRRSTRLQRTPPLPRPPNSKAPSSISNGSVSSDSE
eukprot:c35849_g1_i1 orf=344-1084(-)